MPRAILSPRPSDLNCRATAETHLTIKPHLIFFFSCQLHIILTLGAPSGYIIGLNDNLKDPMAATPRPARSKIETWIPPRASISRELSHDQHNLLLAIDRQTTTMNCCAPEKEDAHGQLTSMPVLQLVELRF